VKKGDNLASRSGDKRCLGFKKDEKKGGTLLLTSLGEKKGGDGGMGDLS